MLFHLLFAWGGGVAAVKATVVVAAVVALAPFGAAQQLRAQQGLCAALVTMLPDKLAAILTPPRGYTSGQPA
jgi:hypothetical protein